MTAAVHLHVKKGDTVLVLSGNDKGKQGQIKEAFPRKGRVLVEGVNLRWKHRKPTQKDPKGERIQLEFPIHASNVMHWDAKLGKGVRKRPAPEAAGKTKKAKKS